VDLLDQRLFHGRRDDIQFAAAVWAVFQVDLEHPLEQVGFRLATALPPFASDC
jgi:hypothetical protein